MKTHSKMPEIRILHQMARSGGTIICKCLGSMRDIILLSEIHPLGTKLFNPLKQAQEWFNLLTPEDIETLKTKRSLDFRDAILLIYMRCLEQHKTLIIRDWSHLDFTAVPFLSKPSYRPTIVDVLKERFSIRNTATVRHPIDQWLSLRKLLLLKGHITLSDFLHGYLHFAEHCLKIGFIRYEDFVRSPEAELGVLCDYLNIPYDSGFKNRWASYTKITGEIRSWRAGNKIASVSRQTMEPGLSDAFVKNEDYIRILELLGYEHPE